MTLEPQDTLCELPDERVRADLSSGYVDCFLCGHRVLITEALGLESTIGRGGTEIPTGPRMHAHMSCSQGFRPHQLWLLYQRAVQGAVANLHPGLPRVV